MKASWKNQFLHGVMILWQEIKTLTLFFHPKYFWMVYLCYTFLLLQGFLGPSGLNLDVIVTQSWITSDSSKYGLSYTGISALVMWLILVYRSVTIYRKINKILILFALVHTVLIVLWADGIIDSGWMIPWILLR